MLTLDVLRKALAPIQNYGQDEYTFEINGGKITVRALLPLEEVAVQRYSLDVIRSNRELDGVAQNEEGMTKASAMDYLDRFRIEVLANCIVQIGEVDLRNETRIATGEVLENGTQVFTTKTAALRKMLEGWSRGALSIAFDAYGKLVQKLQDEADNIASKSLTDLDIELNRLESRLQNVREERARRAVGDPSVFNDQVSAILNAEQELEKRNEEILDQAFQQAPRGPREPVIPPTAPPPGATSVDVPKESPEPQKEVEVSVGPGGVETYRMPAQNLSDRGRIPPQVKDLNPSPRGETNPNFRPSTKPNR
jgi:hypothetical protein